MSEVTFAKTFLATLDKKPIKLAADHVSDPRRYPNQSPYILPKQSHPFPKQTGPTSTQQAQATTVSATLKAMRSDDAVVLFDITLDTTVHDLKAHYASKTNLASDKIKLLLNKKPTSDLKMLKELGVTGNVEFSVMVMGGASAAAATPSGTAPSSGNATPIPEKMDVDSPAPAATSPAPVIEAAQAEADSIANEALKSDAFWDDLKGFLSQRLRNESEGDSLVKIFRDAWAQRGTA